MERLDSRAVHFLRVVLMALALWSALFWLAGCSQSAGWRFSIGVSPVASINEQQVLTDKRK